MIVPPMWYYHFLLGTVGTECRMYVRNSFRVPVYRCQIRFTLVNSGEDGDMVRRNVRTPGD